MRITTQPLQTDGLGWLAFLLIAAPALFILYRIAQKKLNQKRARFLTKKALLQSIQDVRQPVVLQTKKSEQETSVLSDKIIAAVSSEFTQLKTPKNQGTRQQPHVSNRSSVTGHVTASIFRNSRDRKNAKTPTSDPASEHSEAPRSTGSTPISFEDSEASSISVETAESIETISPEISFARKLQENMRNTLEALKKTTLSPENYADLTRMRVNLQDKIRTREISFEEIDRFIAKWNAKLNTFALKQAEAPALYSFLQSCYLHHMKAEDIETLDQFKALGMCSGQGTYYLYERFKNDEGFSSNSCLFDFDVRIDVENVDNFASIEGRIQEKFGSHYKIIKHILPVDNILSITLEPKNRFEGRRKIDLTICLVHSSTDSRVERIDKHYARFSNIFVQSNGKLFISHEQMQHTLDGTPMIDVNLEVPHTTPIDTLRAFLFKTVFRFRDSILEGKIILSENAKEEIKKLLVAYKDYNACLKAGYFPYTNEYTDAIATAFRKYNMTRGADRNWYRPHDEGWLRVNPKEYCDFSRMESVADDLLAICENTLAPARRLRSGY